MNEGNFRAMYEGEFPPLIEEVKQAHNILAEKLYGREDPHMTGCTSYIQRQLQCGYSHASAIMELMEEKGWITAADNRGARQLKPRS